MAERDQNRPTLDPTRYVRIGRYYCPACGTVAAVVRDAAVELVVCPCGGVAVPTSGDERA